MQSDPTQSNCYTQPDWLNEPQPIKQLFRVASHQIQIKQALTNLNKLYNQCRKKLSKLSAIIHTEIVVSFTVKLVKQLAKAHSEKMSFQQPSKLRNRIDVFYVFRQIIPQKRST